MAQSGFNERKESRQRTVKKPGRDFSTPNLLAAAEQIPGDSWLEGVSLDDVNANPV